MKPFICDTHSDTLMRMIDLGYSFRDDRLEVNLPKMLNGGHDLQIFAWQRTIRDSHASDDGHPSRRNRAE